MKLNTDNFLINAFFKIVKLIYNPITIEKMGFGQHTKYFFKIGSPHFYVKVFLQLHAKINIAQNRQLFLITQIPFDEPVVK